MDWIGSKVCLMKISSIGWLLLTFNGKNLKNVINCQATAVIKKKKKEMFLKQFSGRLRSGISCFSWWVSFAPNFQCCYFCEASCLFYRKFNFDFYVS